MIRGSEFFPRRPSLSETSRLRRIDMRFGCFMVFRMASITIKDIPADLHEQLKREAEANFRSLNQEVLARVQRTFEIDAALNTKRDQRWIDEAMASGPPTPLTKKELDAIRDQCLKRRKTTWFFTGCGRER